MKITFIKVNMFERTSKDALMPLIFPIIDKLTPDEFDINFIDDRISKLPDIIDSDIIAFSVETFAAKRAYILAKKFKNKNNHIVMGGFHASVEYEEALKYADTVLIGDAEDTWPRFINDFKNGICKSIYKSELKDNIPKIDYKFFNKNKSPKYPRIGVMQFSRGCRFNCDFCSIKTVYKGKIKKKKIDDIIQEINDSGFKYFFFADDNLFVDEEFALELFSCITDLNIKWACQISMDIAKNEKLLDKMEESGCFLVLIGFESLNKNNLKVMNKGANILADDYNLVIKNIYKRKILIYATFVFGYDFDDVSTIKDTLDFALRCNFAVANFNTLMPMPGTRLYERLEKENRLLFKKWWLSDKFKYGDAMFIPRGMSYDDLKMECYIARKKFYSLKNIIKRFFHNLRNISFTVSLLFLAINFISRFEVRKKQGETLGGILNETDVD